MPIYGELKSRMMESTESNDSLTYSTYVPDAIKTPPPAAHNTRQIRTGQRSHVTRLQRETPYTRRLPYTIFYNRFEFHGPSNPIEKKNKPWLKVRNIIIAYIASMNNMTGFTGYISIYIVTSILLFNKMRTCICVPLGNVRMPRPSCSRCMGRSSCAPVVSIGA